MRLPDPLHRLAARQSGLLTAEQCRAAGVTREEIRHALRSARWETSRRGVYQTRPGRNDWLAGATAAVLACGEPAALGFFSAARLIGLDDGWARRRPEPFHVCIPESRRIATPDGVRLHRVTDYASRVQLGAWPARSTVPDTVLDLASVSDLDGAVGWVARALQKELTTSELVLECLDRRGKHRHAADLRELLDESGIESPAELRFARDVAAAHGLPPGRRQVADGRRGWRVVDVRYDEQLLLVEIDGRVGHGGWTAQRRDAGRDIRAAGGGWTTLRPGWTDVRIRPCEFGADLYASLAVRGWRGRPHGCRRPTCAVRTALRSGS